MRYFRIPLRSSSRSEEVINRLIASLAVVAFASACDKPGQSKAGKDAPSVSAATAAAIGRLKELVASNATVIGYLYTVDKPFVIASFDEGSLRWRSDRESPPMAQGAADFVAEPDRMCVGFELKKASMPDYGPARYLVCEAVRPIEHSNALPRSQDFRLDPGTMFLQYEPPAGAGFPQYYYAAVSK